MSDHLPECLLPDFDKSKWVCICHLLRACEQRAREDERDNCWSAVAELVATEFLAGVPEWWIVKADALAAIDALMVGRSGNPGTPPSAEEGEQAYCAGLDAVRKKIMGLPYEIDGEIWVDRDEVLAWIDALKKDI